MNNRFPYTIVDLTHTLHDSIPTWDGNCGYRDELKLDYGDCKTDVKFRVQQLKMHAGIGTHIDAPSHVIQGAASVEAIALENLIVPVVCIDVSAKMDPDYILSPSDIIDFEQKHGEITKGCFVIVYTGWSKYWDTRKKYHNNYRFPSISKSAAEFLLARQIVGLGIDTLSPDVPSSGFPVHERILGAGKYIVENVANADRLINVDAHVLILPIKAAALTEAPVRMVGLIHP